MPDKIFDFFGKRKIFFGISIAIVVFTVVMLFINGVSLDIQFKGGAIIKYGYTGVIDQEAVAQVAESIVGTSVYVQETADLTGANRELALNIAGDEGLTPETQEELFAALTAAFPENGFEVRQTFNVDPFYGREFLEKGLLAISLAVVLILLYVALRFRSIHGFSAGATALLALLHDVIVVFAVFVIFGIPINDAFVAVLLTIIGYSINDTIVIYDRVRENERLHGGKMALADLVNLSMNQTLARTINTSVSTFIAIACVLVVALVANLSSIVNFALPMMFGVVSGCYSTIFIACPVWVMWNNRKGKG